jgi:intracellular septation protein
MQIVVDFLPVIAFFAVYQFLGIYAATAAIIAVMAIQIAIQFLQKGSVNKMLLVSGILVALFGGATLWLRNGLFIQWKPTIVNWLFALAFLGSQYFGDKTLTERMMGHAVELEARFWRQLNVIWVANFGFLGAANLYVIYNYDEATWVNFKLFGMLGLTLVTAIGQAVWITSRVRPDHQEEH